MDPKTIAAERLRKELQGSRVRLGPGFVDFDLDRALAAAETVRVVKHNRRRQVYCLQSAGQMFFIKRTTLVRPKDRRRLRVLPWRKMSEWRNLHRLQAMGVAAPRPVMFGDGFDLEPPAFFLITTRVEGAKPTQQTSSEDRALGRFVADLHRLGVYHADLHPGNLLLIADGEYALLDTQAVYILPRLVRWLRVRNLGRLGMHFPLPDQSHDWAGAFLEGYNLQDSRPVDPQELAKAIGRQRERRYRSRAKRCCRDSSRFVVVSTPQMQGYAQRGFHWTYEQLQAGLRAGRFLKADRVIVHDGVCIKIHRRRRLHRDRALTSWKMSQALAVRGIPVPRALAYLCAGDRTYFLNEYIADGQRLNDYLTTLQEEVQKRSVLKKLAQWVKTFHGHRLWQRDFKSSNIICSGGDFYLVDLDGVRVKRIGAAQRLINLAQLNASISHAVNRRDRLRFFHYYTAGEFWSRRRRRMACDRIWEITKTKNTAMYGLDLDQLRSPLKKTMPPSSLKKY